MGLPALGCTCEIRLFDTSQLSSTEGHEMKCVEFQQFTVIVLCTAITGEKYYSKYQLSNTGLKQYTHINCVCTIWWLVLAWVNTREDHPPLASFDRQTSKHVWSVNIAYNIIYYNIQ